MLLKLDFIFFIIIANFSILDVGNRPFNTFSLVKKSESYHKRTTNKSLIYIVLLI